MPKEMGELSIEDLVGKGYVQLLFVFVQQLESLA